jgi:hypothetical protein
MIEFLNQFIAMICLILTALVLVPMAVYLVMKTGTFAVLMGRKKFLEYQIRKEEERQHGKS